MKLPRLMKPLRSLSTKSKLELISKILKFDLNKWKSKKETLLEKFCGSRDNIKDDLAEDIFKIRYLSLT